MRTLEILVSQREIIAIIYEHYAHRFPGYENLWSGFAKDELDVVTRLRRYLAAGISQDECALAGKEESDIFMRLINTERAIMDEPRLSLLHALTATFEIEESLACAPLPSMSQKITSDIEDTFRTARRTDERHLEQIRIAMEKFS